MSTLSRILGLVAALLVIAPAYPAWAEQKAETEATPAVLLAPASSLGNSNRRELQALETLIESGLDAMGSARVVRARDAENMSRKARRPELRSCDGDNACLAQLGILGKANYVVYAEVGGLGDANVVYLKLVDVASGKEVRSTTLEIAAGTNERKQAEAAAIRLWDPQRYVGSLRINTPVEGATIFLDGHSIAKTPSPAVRVFVGSHALRVTHPEHRDFVRFVDIHFGEETSIDVELQDLPGLSRSLSRESVIGSPSTRRTSEHLGPRPWYRKWYVVAGGALLVGVSSAIIANSLASDDINADIVKQLDH